ncbi:MAG: hypothetical protein K6G52_03190 [Treponemataceae bacterium]|nr:hypothetical protein [Treponemataceae bacterium]
MKKIIVMLCCFSFLAAFSFACTYNEETHELKECTEYTRGDGEIPQACQDAHTAYNKYIAAKVGKKAKNAAARLGNSIVKFVGDAVKDTEEKAEDENGKDAGKKN